MKIVAGYNKNTGEVIYSRHQYDFITDSEGNFMDGGQLTDGYRRGGNLENFELIHIELIGVKSSDLINDYHYSTNKYGRLSKSEVETLRNNAGNPLLSRILAPEEVESRSSYEFIKNNKVWGTYGKDGKSPLKYKNIVDLNWDHIEAILKTQTHISIELKQMFVDILTSRKFKVVGDHPTLARPDKFNMDYFHAKFLVEDLERMGYENVKMSEM